MTPNPQYPGQQYPGAPAGGPQRTSKLATAALIFGLIGGLLPCPFGLVAIGLGIAALVSISNNPGLGGRGLAIAGIVVPIVMGSMVGILAAIAIPNFIRFQARAKQSECRANLKSVFTAQKSYFQEKDQYSSLPQEIGFSPERGNRYAYFLDVSGSLQDRSSAALSTSGQDETGIGVDTFKYGAMRSLTVDDMSAALAGRLEPGVQGQCPDCSFTAVCAGNLDQDGTLDVWSISSEDRTIGAERVMAGVPFNHVNDVTD
jgi:type IV pilus assembly protein PilA